MKYLVLFTIYLFGFSLPLIAQRISTDTSNGKSNLYDIYLKKSNKKLKASRTLTYLAIGSAAASAVSFIVAKSKESDSPYELFSGLTEGIVGVGFGVVAIGSGLTAFLLNKSSKKYKRAASSIKPTVGLQTIPKVNGKTQQLDVGIVLQF